MEFHLNYYYYLDAFIDFGSTRMCSLTGLKHLPADRFLFKPPYCFPCGLSSIQPPNFNCPNGVWNAESKRLFVEKTNGQCLKVEVRHLYYIETIKNK